MFYRVHLPLLDDVDALQLCECFNDFLPVSNFYDQFRSPRVMCLNWRKHPLYLQLLLSLCGDIHLNPGPDVFPCGLCGEAVFDQDKAICCDSCGKWIHVSCDQYFTEDGYDYLVQNPSSDPWFCSACIEEPAEDPSGCRRSTLQCVCFNARSLFPKRYDLLGYLSSVNVDIVAVTETFLDDTILSSQFCPKHYICFRKDRDRHGGGVLILIKSSIPAVRRPEFESL